MALGVPSLPFDGKLLHLPRTKDSLYSYLASSLEAREKFDIFTERDLGIPVEAIDPDAYITPRGQHFLRFYHNTIAALPICLDAFRSPFHLNLALFYDVSMHRCQTSSR